MHISKENRNYLHEKKNVVGVGLGTKYIRGEDTGERCITVFVKEKLPPEKLEDELLPKTIGKIKIDVVGCGEILPLATEETTIHREKHRPVIGGISCGQIGITLAGTIGVPLAYKNGIPVMISNTHVIARYWDDKRLQANEIERYSVKPGLLVSQPGALDHGPESDAIATLLDWSTFSLEQDNFLDAAIAELTTGAKNEILELGEYTLIKDPYIGMEVYKSGRTSGVTQGKITSTNLSIDVPYEMGTMRMVDQMAIFPGILFPGDSGSAIVNEASLVGLGFAGSVSMSVASPMKTVFKKFGMTLNMDEKISLLEKIREKINLTIDFIISFLKSFKDYLGKLRKK